MSGKKAQVAGSVVAVFPSPAEQFRHLVDPEKCAAAEKSFGRIVSRVVYYRGPDFDHASGVMYRNVENYLSGLKA